MPRSLALLVLLLVAGTAPARAQGRVDGRVVGPEGGAPAAPLQVILHRVSPERQGPLDSTVTDAAGRFGFRVQADTGAVYLVSARHHDVNYFSDPVPGTAVRDGLVLDLVVADTASMQALDVLTRRLLVGAQEPGAAREAVELVVLRNPGPRTRVADPAGATLALSLPEAVSEVEVLDGDFSPDAVTVEQGVAVLGAPVSPGVRRLILRYHLPDRAEVPWRFTAPVDTLEVLFEEPGARVDGLPAAAAEPGLTFVRFAGSARAGTAVTLRFGRAPGPPGWVVPALVGALLLAFAAALVRLRRLPRAADLASRGRGP